MKIERLSLVAADSASEEVHAVCVPLVGRWIGASVSPLFLKESVH